MVKTHQHAMITHWGILTSVLAFCLIGSAAAIDDASFEAFPPLLGCDDDFVNGIPKDDECYAVDASFCRFRFESGCREVLATYYYYIGNNQDYPLENYHTVDIIARSNCNESPDEPNKSCRISINRIDCNSCTNQDRDYRSVTLEDCSNIPGVFPTENQTIPLVFGGLSHLKLAYNETRCNHPYFQDTAAPSPALTASPTPRLVTSAPVTRAPTTPLPTYRRVTSAPLTRGPITSSLSPITTTPITASPATPGSTTAPTTAAFTTVPTAVQEGTGQMSKSEQSAVVIHPRLKISSVPDTLDVYTVLSLVQDTHVFFQDLLHDHLSPQLQEFSISELSTGKATDNPQDFWLNFTATLILEAADIPTRQIVVYFSDDEYLEEYWSQAVLKSIPQSQGVRAWIAAPGMGIVARRNPK